MRWAKRILVFVSIVLLGAAAYGVFTVRRSFPQWVDGEHGPMPWTRSRVESVAVDRLTMVPAE